MNQNSRSISAYFQSISAITLFFISILSLCFVETSHAVPALVAQSYAVVSDDGDGSIEPNECVGITITLLNNGVPLTSVTGTLTSVTAGVTTPVADATQSFPNISTGGTGTNSVPFHVSLSSVLTCGLPVNLTLNVNTDQGVFSVPVTLATGSVPPITNTLNDSANKNIKDGHGQVTRSKSVSNITTAIVKVTATVYITHAKDSDLSISLIGPDNTTVDLSSNNGGTGDDYGTSCGAQTTFDDAAATSITAGVAPFTGSFKPESPLSAFNGKSGPAANGNWKLRVRDSVRNNQKGKLVCWSVKLYYGAVCGDGGNCPGSVDVVKFSSANVTNGNFIADVNDCFDLSVGLRNDGTADATGISGATLTTTTPGVTILQGTSNYASIPQGGTVANSTSFQVETLPSVACGSKIDFVLSGSSALGGSFSIPFQLPVGESHQTSATGPSVITDGDSNGTDLNIPVSGITGTVGKVSLNLNISHTRDSDLTISLIGPDNTEVVLSSGNGGSGEDYGFDCDDSTGFDDGASTAIADGVAPFSGVFIPQEALSAFNGKDPNGTWKLHVVDNNLNSEVGQIECATLTLQTCIDGNCCPTITLDGTLGDANSGVSYNGSITADGGAGPYTFEVTSGALPTGFSMDDSGTITGTSTVSGNYDFEVTATDSHGCAGKKNFSISVSCSNISLDDTLADGTTGVAYNGTILASAGTEPYTYAVTNGSLPDGLVLNSNGTLSGTPTSPNTFNFEVTATDAIGCTAKRDFNIVVACPEISLDDTLADGTTGIAYSHDVVASGGTGPYTYAVTDGSLPTGLALDENGTLSGTPTSAETFNFEVTATDANGCTGKRSYEVKVKCPVISLDDTLADGTTGIPYSGTVVASNGTGPYSYSVTGGSLPTGLTLSSNGVLSGTPTSANTFNFEVTATDAYGCTAKANYDITVVCPVISLDDTLADGTTGVSYSGTVVASNGSGPYSYSVTGGSLPNGLTLSSNGELSGTPTSANTFNFEVTATDAYGCSGKASYEIIVVCPVISLDDTLADGTTGVSYSGIVVASNGSGPYSYSVTGGSLPNGLTLSSNGELSGTPTSANTFSFEVTATDAYGCTAKANYEITVVCPAISLDDTLADGTTGVSYSGTVVASNGTGPYSYAVTSGNLPAGLTLGTNGALSGTPTAEGTFNFHVTATDVNGCSGEFDYSIQISCSTIVLDDTLSDGTVGVAYSGLIAASGSTSSYVYSLTSGFLPGGLNLDASGNLTGVPVTPGTYNFTVTATDAYGCSANALYGIVISCPVITLDQDGVPGSAVLTSGTVNVPYSSTITASGGIAPYTYATTDPLPAGLVLSPAGIISGMTEKPVTNLSFNVTATDANGCTATKSFSITLGVMGPGCIFCDDFNDDDFTNPLWKTKGGAWSAASGDLETTSSKRTTAYAPDFGGCPGGLCTIIADVSVESSGKSAHIFGWYNDTKTNVEIRLSLEKQQIYLKSRVNRHTVAKRKVPMTVNAGQTYVVKVVFDGTFFQVYLDGVHVMTDIPKGVDPSSTGSVAFRVKPIDNQANAGTLEDIQVLP